METGAIAFCLGLLVILGAAERWRRDRDQAQVPIRVHVNGTRGKSTVTRLIAGALREAGIPTVAKTTGTAARLVLPDGSERPVARRAPANIHEQLWLLREARRLGAHAAVIECMAVDPALQWISEHEMVGATLGVITNARTDHGEAMGRTRDEVALALAGTVPRRGTVVVIGEPDHSRPIIERAAAAGTRVVPPDAIPGLPESLGTLPGWLRDDMRIALAATRELGVADDVALRGMQRAAPDPGALASGTLVLGGRSRTYLDATAANDPESLDRLLGEPPSGRADGRTFVYNHRADRPDRLREFIRAALWTRPGDRLIVTGDRPDWLTWRRARRQPGGTGATFAARRRLAAALADVPPNRLLVFCGNTRGFDVHTLGDRER